MNDGMCVRETVEGLKQRARSEGFSDVRVTAAVDSRGYARLVEWLEAGFAGQMDYFQKRLSAYRHPRGVLPDVRTLVVLTYPYPASPCFAAKPGFGKTARYTWVGRDYHDLIHQRLKRLCRYLETQHAGCAVRGVVDTAPLLEREFAELAGIGWRAKNTLVINKYSGSYFFLACLLTDLDLPIDQPHATDHCGTCQRCLEACPTDAFPAPGVLNASRCISYLTIEHRDPIPVHLRVGVGDWLFGCDVCQEVCPWNQPQRLKKLEQEHLVEELPSQAQLELSTLFDLDDEQFRRMFRKTPMWRSKRRGMLRNAAIVMGNAGDEQAVPALAKGLKDGDPLIRGACVWALRKIASTAALAHLESLRLTERDPLVIAEFADGPAPEIDTIHD